jgi:hypothetical protein
VQQHPLVARREAQRRAHLGRAPPLHVTQDDHRTLALGQLVERVADHRPHLPRQCPGLRPRRLTATPGAQGAVPGRGVAGQRGPAHRPGLPRPPGTGGVDQDPHEPGLERGTGLEAVHAAQHRHPGVLHDVLGDVAAGHVAARQPEHQRGVPAYQGEIGVLVAAAEGGDEHVVGKVGRHPGDRRRARSDNRHGDLRVRDGSATVLPTGPAVSRIRPARPGEAPG